MTSASTSATSSRASGCSPTASPATARATTAGCGRSRSRGPRRSAPRRSTRSCSSRRRGHHRPRLGALRERIQPGDSRPATCCRSRTTTRAWCRASPTATTRSTPTTRPRSARSPPTSGWAGCAPVPRGPRRRRRALVRLRRRAEAPLARSAPAPCGSCGFLLRLAGPLSGTFGVCANGDANDDGRVVAIDHGCGAHSEARWASGPSRCRCPTTSGTRHRRRARPRLTRRAPRPGVGLSAVRGRAGGGGSTPAQQAQAEPRQAGPQPPQPAGLLEVAVERQQRDEGDEPEPHADLHGAHAVDVERLDVGHDVRAVADLVLPRLLVADLHPTSVGPRAGRAPTVPAGNA